MATKSSGVDLAVDTPANVGQAGIGGGTYSVQILNRDSTTAIVQLGVSATTAAFEDARMILNAETLNPGKSITYAPVVCEASEFIVGQSDTIDVNMLMMGHDE